MTASISKQLQVPAEYANVLGVKVSAINMDLAVRMADDWVASGRTGYVCVTGVHGVMEAQTDPELLRILNSAVMNTPDGMPMTWIGRLQGFHEMDRVYGPDLMTAICKLSVARGYRNFFYGGKPGVAGLLSRRLQERFPGLQVAGMFTPPFRPLNSDEERELITAITRSKPHILWVGLSTPKQEHFMAEYIRKIPVPLMIGVGAAFDYHTGAIRECSAWAKRAGLQWLHRLLQDPKRLLKRYLRCNSAFLWHIAMQLSGLRQYPADRITEPAESSNVLQAPASPPS